MKTTERPPCDCPGAGHDLEHREAAACMWAVTTRTKDGRVMINGLGNTHVEAEAMAGECGPERRLDRVTVGLTTRMGAQLIKLRWRSY